MASLFICLSLGLRCGLVVSVLDCQPRDLGFEPPEQKFVLRFLPQLRPLVNSVVSEDNDHTLSVGRTSVRDRTAKTHMPRLRSLKSLMLHGHGCSSGLAYRAVSRFYCLTNPCGYQNR